MNILSIIRRLEVAAGPKKGSPPRAKSSAPSKKGPGKINWSNRGSDRGEQWLAYWKDVDGSYKTKPISSPSDVGDLVEKMYRKYNTFFNVGSIQRKDWDRLKGSFV